MKPLRWRCTAPATAANCCRTLMKITEGGFPGLEKSKWGARNELAPRKLWNAALHRSNFQPTQHLGAAQELNRCHIDLPCQADGPETSQRKQRAPSQREISPSLSTNEPTPRKPTDPSTQESYREYPAQPAPAGDDVGGVPERDAPLGRRRLAAAFRAGVLRHGQPMRRRVAVLGGLGISGGAPGRRTGTEQAAVGRRGGEGRRPEI